MLQLEITHKMMLLGLDVRGQELQKTVAEFNTDHAAVMRSIEKDLSLETGAIGTTHLLDLASGAVVAKSQEYTEPASQE
jgi:hypothetical protein